MRSSILVARLVARLAPRVCRLKNCPRFDGDVPEPHRLFPASLSSVSIFPRTPPGYSETMAVKTKLTRYEPSGAGTTNGPSAAGGTVSSCRMAR